MNPRIRALLDTVRDHASQHMGTVFARVCVHRDFVGAKELRLIGETIPLGPHERRYEMRLFPAVSEQEVIPDLPKLQFTFVVFSPTGEHKKRRDAIERARKSGPNEAFVEMCTDLAPFMPEVEAITDMLLEDFKEYWPARSFAPLVTATSAELDLVSVFADVASLKQLAIAVAADAATEA